MILTQPLSQSRCPRPFVSIEAIALQRFDCAPIDAAFWPALADTVQAWLRARDLPARDAIVLLPYAELLAPARAAFAAAGGWQPRVETTRTLAASLAPTQAADAGQLSFDGVVDRLTAAAMLLRQPWAAAWARSDARGFEHAVAAVADAAQALARAAQAQPPTQREAWWNALREALPTLHGPGASERLLARIALEWAALAEAPASDALWTLPTAAWIALRCGGADPLVEALLAASDRPALQLDADPPADAPFDRVAGLVAPRRVVCDGLEEEAQAAVAAVIDAVAAGHTPVALIAQDRLLVRRARALLERAGIAIDDETGWTLSTTRAAARVMALLRAAAGGAGPDARLDWLKSLDLPPTQRALFDQLEARRRRNGSALAVSGDDAPETQALWQRTEHWLQPLSNARRQSLQDWLMQLGAALADSGTLAGLSADSAGRQVLAALHLDAAPMPAAWRQASGEIAMGLAEFTAWVDATLEQSSFLSASAQGSEVVITPLGQALLRPFGAVVLAGTDDKRLGASATFAPLWSDAVAQAFGLPGRAAQRERERLAFAQILRAPRLTLLRRRSDGNELLAASPLVALAMQARVRLGQPSPPETVSALPRIDVAVQGTARPAPVLRGAMPQRLSASAVQALRDCPYRFFARSLLGLAEAPELEAELEKRDYGTWLHAVLWRFHTARSGPRTATDDHAALLQAADAEQDAQALDAAALLPFRAAFDNLAARYVAWLAQRDAQGWHFERGEVPLRNAPPEFDGLQLDGRIDRVDARGDERQLIDYKTGSAEGLKKKVREPLEDTQLAFYASLLPHDGPVRAIYLVLDERKPPLEVEHPNVADSAVALVEGLAQDLSEMRGGAGLPALGEGPVCAWCEMRGLCRRDDWSASEAGA